MQHHGPLPGDDDRGPIWSHTCTLDELLSPFALPDPVAGQLPDDVGWPRRWTTTWKTASGDVVIPVRDLTTSMPAMLSVPVRRFSWRTGQRHRPGLAYLVSTGRQHGFESLAEYALLLALDFASAIDEVLAQPFRLRFDSLNGPGEHVPDFLALTPGSAWLLDVRPASRIKPPDMLRFAASARAARAVGWRYAVVTGWRRQVMTTIDTLSAQRRPLADPLDLQRCLRAAVRSQPRQFADLVDRTAIPALARAQVIHLLWHRDLAMDLRQPVEDATWIYPAGDQR